MPLLFRLWLFLVLGAVLSRAVSTSGNRVLVVLEDLGEQSKYAKLWADIAGREYQLQFESPKNEKLALFQHGERRYDHIVLLPAKSKGLGPSLTPSLLLKFLNLNGNILLALSSTTPTPSAISALLLELDIHLPSDRTSQVVDHFRYDELSASERHDVLLVPRPDTLRSGVANFFNGPGLERDLIAFPRGVGHALGNESPLLAPILRAPDTAYAFNPKDDAETVEEPFATGRQLSLVSALQARNSARLVVLGSVEMLEDAWFDAQVKRNLAVVDGQSSPKLQATANRAFAREVFAWTFKERGVLAVGRVRHRLLEAGAKAVPNETTAVMDAASNPRIYRVKSEVAYYIELSEYDYDHYKPFTPPADDRVQLEFTMLSPYHRLSLQPWATSSSTSNATIYTTTLTLPDQHGIFAFRVNYKRPFYTAVDEKTSVTVRHYAHDEWPRSWRISGAWVWIAGIWMTVVSWLLFVALWLYSSPSRLGASKKLE
ncbi:MAG: oligosaccharyl transferase glycoprotein complex, beta subunit [Phylliscum demangeonii]|nr:MAG: oligosaccharyl transferase glycoprotein complex, beta subunit [Phylliscum demangeonii]